MNYNISNIHALSMAYDKKLGIIKSNIVRDSKFNPGKNTRDNNLCNIGFYPYSILANFHHLKNLLGSNGLSNFSRFTL